MCTLKMSTDDGSISGGGVALANEKRKEKRREKEKERERNSS